MGEGSGCQSVSVMRTPCVRDENGRFRLLVVAICDDSSGCPYSQFRGLFGWFPATLPPCCFRGEPVAGRSDNPNADIRRRPSPRVGVVTSAVQRARSGREVVIAIPAFVGGRQACPGLALWRACPTRAG